MTRTFSSVTRPPLSISSSMGRNAWIFSSLSTISITSEGQKRMDLLLAVHDLDHKRQIGGEPEDLRRVKAARLAESHVGAEHGCAGNVHFPSLEHDGLVKGLMAPLVGFADEYPQEQRVVGYFHGDAFRAR